LPRQPDELLRLVRDGSFSARDHHRLLGSSPDLPWPAFSNLQIRYRDASSNSGRRQLALQFEQLVQEAHARAARGEASLPVDGDPFSLPHFEAWSHKLVCDNGKPLELEPFQRAFVEDVFSGKPVCWLVVPEGNGKTTLIAALGLYGVRFGEGAQIPIAASTRDQIRIMYRQMKGFVTRSQLGQVDHEGRWLECFDGYRQIHLRGPGNTRRGETLGQIEVYAADAGSADGVIPYPYGFLDELHRHKDLALHRTWRGKLNKRGAQLIVISTAGEPGHEFESTRERIKVEASETFEEGPFARFATDQVVMHEWMVRNEADILKGEAVAAANPLSAVTEENLQAKLQDPTMTQAHWTRFTCNRATRDEGKEPFIDLEDWDGAASPASEVGKRIFIGADGSRTWDTTVVAWASLNEDGIVDVDARVFSVRKDIPCHVLHERGKIDFGDVEAFVIDLFDRFYVEKAAYDPRYLERSMEIVSTRLPEADVQPVEPSSKDMREALQAMFNLVAEGRLRHKGDAVLRGHIANAGAERGLASDASVSGGELRRVRRLDGRLPIDAVPAMALAVWKAAELQLNTEPLMMAL